MTFQEFDPVPRFVAGTVGPTGNRTFYLQASDGRRVVTVALEKQQVSILADRINDAQSRVVITCDGAWLRGKTVNLKEITDEALTKTPTVQSLVVLKRTNQEVNWVAGRDHWWHDLVADASAECETERMDAEDPMFILYTSGSTGKPKGQLHTSWGWPSGRRDNS